MPATGLNRYLPDWSVTSSPGAAGRATATRPASLAPQFAESRHVATSVTATLCFGVTVGAAVAIQVNLRDGATGAGTILGSWVLAIQALAGACVILSLDTIEIIGSPNTAMTLEFVSTGDANTIESVTLTGHTL
jgi:hypothetical protein